MTMGAGADSEVVVRDVDVDPDPDAGEVMCCGLAKWVSETGPVDMTTSPSLSFVTLSICGSPSSSSVTLASGDEDWALFLPVALASKPQKSVFPAFLVSGLALLMLSALRMPSNVVGGAVAGPVGRLTTGTVGKEAVIGVCTPNFRPQRHSLG